MGDKKLRTVGDAIKFAQDLLGRRKVFFGHGTDNSWDEAVYLVLFNLDIEQTLTEKILQRNLASKERQSILQMLKKRVEEKIPLAYLTGEAYFAGLKFYVDSRVLIPRSPLGELIGNKFHPWLLTEKVTNILEIGTGSGCIAIGCAKVFKEARVDAVDIDESALQVAHINCLRHRVKSRIRLLQGDLFSKIPAGQHYDIIISNPPYVGEEEFNSLPREYYYEPKQALLAGKRGDEFAVAILEQAVNYLKPRGILVIEVGNSASLVAKKYRKLPLLWLEFENGDSEVILVTREQLVEFFA